MEYVIPVVLVVLLVGGLVTFLALNATKKSGSVAEADEGPPGIGQDETPLGDTTEHAGEQTEGGVTASDPESGGARSDDPDAAAHVARPGEGEGAQRLGFEGEQPRREDPDARAERLRREHARPDSERLADRDA